MAEAFSDEIKDALQNAKLSNDNLTPDLLEAYKRTIAHVKATCRLKTDASNFRETVNKIYTEYVLPELAKHADIEIKEIVDNAIENAVQNGVVRKLTRENPRHTRVICGGPGVGKTVMGLEFDPFYAQLYNIRAGGKDIDDICLYSRDRLNIFTHENENLSFEISDMFYEKLREMAEHETYPSVVIELADLPDDRPNGIREIALLKNGRNIGTLDVIVLAKQLHDLNTAVADRARGGHRLESDEAREVASQNVAKRSKKISIGIIKFIQDNTYESYVQIRVLHKDGMDKEWNMVAWKLNHALTIFDYQALIKILEEGQNDVNGIKEIAELPKHIPISIEPFTNKHTKHGGLTHGRTPAVFGTHRRHIDGMPTYLEREKCRELKDSDSVFKTLINEIKSAIDELQDSQEKPNSSRKQSSSTNFSSKVRPKDEGPSR